MKIFISLISLTLLFSGIRESSQGLLFEKVLAEKTGIYFRNTLKETNKENMLSFTNFYTGSGVGILDVNNDGLQDIFFGGNQVSCRLYLNKGGLKFEDITENAGVLTGRWVTGVSIVDINQDGFDDIYLSVSGFWSLRKTGNLLFVNNGNNTFSEKAAEYNLNETEQTTHTSFFDYDRDGDLDAFLATNPTDFQLNSVNALQSPKINGEARSTDKLYRNEGNGKFTDVSKEAGILIEGYSLGVNTSDFNNDGWIDIFVTNDYISNDILYINNGDGTFKDKSREYFSYTSFASMGNDAGDINNDGWLDIIVLDMLPESSYRQKTHVLPASYNSFEYARSLGYEPQFSRNVLQLNNGNNTFSEIGQLAGIDRTDWSWASLLTELDNDGDKDLFVSNGFRRDMGNLDYVYYNDSSPWKMAANAATVSSQLKSIRSREGSAIENCVFKNNNDLTFAKTSEEWGFDDKTYSSGLAVADLDNDGDNDIIINNIDQLASVYENKSEIFFSNHYIKIRLQGSSGNQSGIGSKVSIFCEGNLQYIDNNLYRGYLSTVEKNILFGTGKFTLIDSIEVIWPDGLRSIQYGVHVDTTIVIQYHFASPKKPVKSGFSYNSLKFEEISSKLGIKYKHNEDSYVDFHGQAFLPHQHSQLGPSVAVGDINNDGLEDFFIGGASGFSGTLFFQKPDATFRSEKFLFDLEYEDMGALFFDFDGDKDLDLYVVSGGTSVKSKPGFYQDRLYENLGNGKFKKTEHLLPVINSSGGVVTAADFDGDNDLDLFRGGRFSPMSYPVPPGSYLLENRGGHFVDVTGEKAPGLSTVGMVSSALWSDYTGDGIRDLIIVGEWLPVTVFENNGGHFVNKTKELGLENTSGWWNSITAGDINNDGSTDYLLGNLGLNQGYNATESNPLRLVAKDFDNDGLIEPIITMKYIDGYYPVVYRKEFLSVFFQKIMIYKTNEEYAKTTAEELLTDLGTDGALRLDAKHLENCLLVHLAKDSFCLKPLPNIGQLAPIFGSIGADFNKDGKTGFLFVGNFYNNNIIQGPFCAFTGDLLTSDPANNLTVTRGQTNGFYVHTDAKALASLVLGNGNMIYLVTSNNDSLKVFSQIIQKKEQIKLGPLDDYAMIEWADGHMQKQEFYYGSGYLSQSSRYATLPPGWKSVKIFTYSGEERLINSEAH